MSADALHSPALETLREEVPEFEEVSVHPSGGWCTGLLPSHEHVRGLATAQLDEHPHAAAVQRSFTAVERIAARVEDYPLGRALLA